MKTLMISANMLPDNIHNDEKSLINYAFSLLGTVANCAVVPISHFRVGAIAIDSENNFYFGVNQEYIGMSLAHSVHAEQSAIANAWSKGARAIKHIVVNYTPCGHCRQFLSELSTASILQIHLPPNRHYYLSDLLPDRFGPENLNISSRIFNVTQHHLVPLDKEEILLQTAWQWAKKSYAPYTGAYAGIAVKDSSGEIHVGAYLENVAFNPSLPALQMAMNNLHLSGKTAKDIREGALICAPNSGHEMHTRILWETLTNMPLNYIVVNVLT